MALQKAGGGRFATDNVHFELHPGDTFTITCASASSTECFVSIDLEEEE